MYIVVCRNFEIGDPGLIFRATSLYALSGVDESAYGYCLEL
jgi:hypothetical protein